MPAGAVVAGSPSLFLRAVDKNPDTALLRADGLAHLRAVAWTMASMASWSTLTARPTWPVLMERTELSRASVARWLAWLRHHGLLAVVESGWTPALSPLALTEDVANRAAVYVLCVPQSTGSEAGEDSDEASSADPVADAADSVDETETLTHLVFDLERNPYPGARANHRRTEATSSAVDRQHRSDDQGRSPWPRTAVACCRLDRLALVERLQAAAPALRPASAQALRHELRAWLNQPELGWTVAELLYALDHTPDGRPYTFTAPVRIPARWLAHRMSAWRDEHGRPLPAPQAVAAAAGRTAREATARAHAERAEQARQIEEERVFGQLVRDTAGVRYPALVAAVMARQPAAVRLLRAAGAEALTRSAVRDLAYQLSGAATSEPGGLGVAAIAAAVDRLLGQPNQGPNAV